MVLHVPMVGGLAVSTQASVRSDVVARQLDGLAHEAGKATLVLEVRVAIKRFDDLDIAPDGVKIDVEGFEFSVLRGMELTIQKHRPVFMIERNDETDAYTDLLRRHDYVICEYDRQSERLRHTTTPSRTNWFAVPMQSNLVDLIDGTDFADVSKILAAETATLNSL